MTTQAHAVDWAIQQIGKSLDYDGRYGAQCWDLIMFFAKFLGEGMPPAVRSAEAWATTQWPAAFTKIPINQVQAGDIGIWGATPSNADGHAFIVVGVGNGVLDVVDQNYIGFSPNGSPAARHTIQVNSRLTAVIRPTYATNPVAGDKAGEYTIVQGDTFYALEQAHGWPTNTLQQLNPSLDPRKLQIGQRIVVPAAAVVPPVAAPVTPQPKTYVVQNGDNLSVIAHRFGLANWQVLYDANRAVIGADPNLIKHGQVLIIP